MTAVGGNGVVGAGDAAVRDVEYVQLPPLDSHAPLLTPVARRAMVRFGAALAAIWSTGLLLATLGDGRWRVLGAGLMVPGGQHLASGHAVHALVSVLALAVAVIIWWMIGAVVAPVIVWAGDLALAATMSHHDHAEPSGVLAAALALPAVVLLSLGVHAVRHARRRRTAAELNAGVLAAPAAISRVPSSPEPPVREASPEDLERLRFALDLALQPLEAFDGFDRRDQFREAALRYQLCVLGYGLAAYGANVAPAFAGHLRAAHARSIEKFSDKRVWGYWALENAWGRLSLKRDPVDNGDNVMLTGWQGATVGMFESLHDDRFSRPGGLTYRWSDDEAYSYDLPGVVDSIVTNFERSPFTLYSCEPRWIYPVCNTFAINTLLMSRRLHGSDGFDRLQGRVRAAYAEEFHRPDGRIIGVRNEDLGLSWNMWAGEAVWLPTVFWLHPAYPDLAHRSWRLVRETALQERDGGFHLPRGLANRVDGGTYSFGGESFGLTLLAMAAREIGDEEVATRALAQVDDALPTLRSGGAARYDGLSTQGNLYHLMARLGRASGLRDLVAHGLPDAWRTGPRLAEAAYPDVLVARAVTDGAALRCVLHPGVDDGLRAVLALDRLVPGRTYRAAGSVEGEVVADAAGCASVTVDLAGRHELVVEPIGAVG